MDAITDPDALAEETCIVGLIHPESKGILKSLPIDAKTKTRSLLQSIEGKIKDQPVCFNFFLAVLKKQPGLANLGATLQKIYGSYYFSNCMDTMRRYMIFLCGMGCPNSLIIPYPRERGPTTECRPTPHFGLNFLLRSNVYSNMHPCAAALKNAILMAGL